VVDGA